MVLRWANTPQPQMEAELESMAKAQKPQQGADSIPMNHTHKGYNDHDPFPLDSKGSSPPYSCKSKDQEGRRGASLLLEEAPREVREGLALLA